MGSMHVPGLQVPSPGGPIRDFLPLSPSLPLSVESIKQNLKRNKTKQTNENLGKAWRAYVGHDSQNLLRSKLKLRN